MIIHSPKTDLLTSIIKQPPDIHCAFPLFLLELLAGLQQPLVRHIQRNSRALLVCRDGCQKTHVHSTHRQQQRKTLLDYNIKLELLSVGV